MDENKDLNDRLDSLSPEIEKLRKQVDTLSLQKEKLSESLASSNAKLLKSKEEYNNKRLDLSAQEKVNSTLGKTVKKAPN